MFRGFDIAMHNQVLMRVLHGRTDGAEEFVDRSVMVHSPGSRNTHRCGVPSTYSITR